MLKQASYCKRLYISQILKLYASRYSLTELRFRNFVEHKETK